MVTEKKISMMYKITVLATDGAISMNFLKSCSNVSKKEFSLFSTDLSLLYVKELVIEGERIYLHLWALFNPESYKENINLYCKRASGTIILFDLKNHAFQDKLREWINLLRKEDEFSPILLVNTDPHVPYQLNQKKIEEILGEYENISFFRFSSVMGDNRERIFNILVNNIKTFK